MKFVDIKKKAERKFIPLNEHKETKFNSIIKENTIIKPVLNTKQQVLLETLLNAMISSRKQVNESEDVQSLFGTQSWLEFRKRGKTLAQMMGLSDQQIDGSLDELENRLTSLGGSPENGLKSMEDIQKALESSNLTSVTPTISLRNFLNLISPDQYTTGKGKNKETKQMEYDAGIFIKMITGRTGRKFAPIVQSSESLSLKKVLDYTFAEEFKDNIEMAYSIFRKIFSSDSYTKNGSAIGKSELALAMFFGDCRLPDDKSDIELNIGNGGEKIEMKGDKAGITNRTALYKGIILNTKWRQLSSNKAPVPAGLSDDQIWNTLNLEKNVPIQGEILFDDIFDKIESYQEYEDVSEKPNGDEEPNVAPTWGGISQKQPKYNLTAVKFKVAFGALLEAYFAGEGFSTMLLVNTKTDKIDNSSGDSSILNSPVVKINKRDGGNWYSYGVETLNRLLANGIDVRFLDHHSQGTFKAFHI